MSSKRDLKDLSVEELEKLLYRKKRAKRHDRLRRLKSEGRVVDIPGASPPLESESLPRDGFYYNERSGSRSYYSDLLEEEDDETETGLKLRWVANKFLLLFALYYSTRIYKCICFKNISIFQSTFSGWTYTPVS